mgnify:CR=1 FL=1
MDFFNVSFKIVDEETGALLMHAHVRCFQKKNRNACSEVKSDKAGILSLKVPVLELISVTDIKNDESRANADACKTSNLEEFAHELKVT